MGLPFKLQGPKVAVGRATDGKFTRIEEPCPGKVHEQAKSEGRSVEDVVAEQRAPDRAVGSDTAQEAEGGGTIYPETLPWPEAGPINDDDRKPMKLQS